MDINREILDYQERGNKKALSNILKQYEPIVEANVRLFQPSGLPEEMLRAEAKMKVAESAKKYKLGEGNFPAYVKKNLMGMYRTVNNTSMVYVPANRATKISEFQMTKEELGRKYTPEKAAKLMNIHPNEVKRLENEAVKGLYSGEEVDIPVEINDEQDFIQELEKYYISDPKELEVFRNQMSDSPKTDKQMARQLNMSPSGIRKVKDRIINIIEDVDI